MKSRASRLLLVVLPTLKVNSSFTYQSTQNVISLRNYLTKKTYSILTSSLLSKLVPTCKSCGIKLQDSDKNSPGFYYIPSVKKHIKHEDDVFNKALSNLSLEDQQLLTNNNEDLLDTMQAPVKSVSQSEKLAEEYNLPKTIECIRCRNAQFKSEFKQVNEEYPIESIDSIMSSIPIDSNLVYIINGQDFPLSLNTRVFKYTSTRKIKFIVNKVDLLFKTKELSLKYGLTFIQDYLRSKHNINPENVTIISGKTNWNVEKLLKFIENESYIIGHTNSGKSTIIKSLLFQIFKNKSSSKRLNSRDRTKLEKEQDLKINSQSKARDYKSAKQLRKKQELLKNKLGPGTSYMPGFTRGFIEILLGDPFDLSCKTIYDVPGFTNSTHPSVLYDLETSDLKNLSKGVWVYKEGYYYSHYDTLKENRCLTVGGLFYLVPPIESMVQIRSCINFDYEFYRSFENAKHLATHLEENPATRKKFLLKYTPEKFDKKFKRYIIPPFYGSVDLVIQNIGHLNLKPTGAKNNNRPMIIYLPDGLEAIIRQPITEYISKSFSGVDKNGNPLRKENYYDKSTYALKRYFNKAPFFARLIPSKSVELDLQAEEDFKRINIWMQDHGLEVETYDENTKLDVHNKYKYWVE